MIVHGVEMLPANDMVISHQRRTGQPFEAESISAWRSAAAGGLALDIGAYTGLYALVAATVGAKVHAFEPNPSVFRRLADNVRTNGASITLHQLGVAETAGCAQLVTEHDFPLTSGGRLTPGGDIRVVSIDELEIRGVTAVKIDVEGAECDVLRGAIDTLRRDRPLIITETLQGSATHDQRQILAPLGYRPRPADRRNTIWTADD